MSRQLHFGTTYQVQYGYGGIFGSDGQDALYDIFSMFEIENNAEDIYTDDYEIEREELKRLRQMLIDKDEKYRENEEELTRYLTKIEMTLDEFITKVLDRLINESDQQNEYVLISWY